MDLYQLRRAYAVDGFNDVVAIIDDAIAAIPSGDFTNVLYDAYQISESVGNDIESAVLDLLEK